ncbi:hypothetical protein AHF37_01534 [Paragonimus kellicotti]|nr:hypothetical protein AHF37_01534 [Paragonimus kellicotti]
MLASIASDHQLFRTQGSSQFEFAQTTGTERNSSTKLFQRASTNPTLEIALCEEPDSNFIECDQIGEFSPGHLELIDCETTSQSGTFPTLPQTDYALRTPWALKQWEHIRNNQSMTPPRCVPSDQSVQNNHSPNMVYEGTNPSLRYRSSSPSTRQSDDLASLDDQYVRSLYMRQSELSTQLTRLNSELLHLVHEEWILTGNLPEGYDDLRTLLGQNTQPLKGTSYPLPRQLIRRANTFSRGYVNPIHQRRNTSLHSRSMVSSLHTRGKVESKTRSKPKTLTLHQPSYSTAYWAQTHRRSTDSSSQEDLATTPTTAGQNLSHNNTALSSRDTRSIAKSQRYSSTRLYSYSTDSLSPKSNIPMSATLPEITTESTSIEPPDADPGETRLEREESQIDISRAAAELKLRKLEVDFAVISQLHAVHKQRAAETKRDAYKVAYKANYRKSVMRRSASDTSGMEQMFLDESSLQLNVGSSSRPTALRPYLPRVHSLPVLGRSMCSPNQLSECKNIPGGRRLQTKTLEFPNRKSTRFLRMNSAQPVPRKSLESFAGTPLSNLRLYNHIATNGSASFRITTTAMHSVPPKQVTSNSHTSSSNWSTSGCSCLSSQTSGSTYLTDSKCDSSVRTTSPSGLLPARLSLKCAQSAGEAPVSPLCTSADQSAVQGDCSVSVKYTQRVQLRETKDRGRRSVCTQDDKKLNCGEAHSESTGIKCICSCLSDKGALPNLVQYHSNAVEDWPTSVTIPSEGDILDDEDEGVLSISDNEAEDGSPLSKAHRPKLINHCRVSSLESCEITLTGSPLHTTSSSPIGSLNNDCFVQATRKDKHRKARTGRMLDECPPESSKNVKRSSLMSFSLLRRAVSRVASSRRNSACQFTKSSQPLSNPKVLPSLLTRKQIKLKCFTDRQHPLNNITTANDLYTSQPSSLSLQPYSNSSSDVPSPSKLSWTQKLRYSARSTHWPNH